MKYLPQMDYCTILLQIFCVSFQAEDKSKSTPLHCACSQGSIPIVRTLMVKDASLLKRDDEGHTPFHYAVMSGHLKVSVLSLFFRRGSAALLSERYLLLITETCFHTHLILRDRPSLNPQQSSIPLALFQVLPSGRTSLYFSRRIC